MKKLLFVFFTLASVCSYAQSADAVIQKYAANMGGLEAFNKITSVKMTGTVSAQGMDLPVTTQILNGKGMRTDVEVMGNAIVNCYANGKGWKINPYAGAPEPTEVTGTELADFKAQSNVANPLMDYKARGHQVEFLGEENVDGTKAFKIKLTNKDDGKATTYFISIVDYTLLKTISSREMRGEEVEVETFFSDMKEFGGAKFFMTRVQKIEGEEFQSIRFDKLELNVPIDEKIFEMSK